MNREQFALKQRLMSHGHVPPPARFRQYETHQPSQHAAQATVIAPAEPGAAGSAPYGKGSGAPRNEIQREKYGRQR